MSRPSSVNTTDASILLGCNVSQASRLATAGKLGTVTRTRQGNMIAVAAIERHLGRKFADADFAALAREKTSDIPSTAEIAAWREVIDPGFRSAIVEQRDGEWAAHCLALGITVPPPPLPSIAEPYVEVQDTFTRSQVEQLLDNALQTNDRLWRNWASNSIAMAEQPSGPRRTKFKLPTLTQE